MFIDTRYIRLVNSIRHAGQFHPSRWSIPSVTPSLHSTIPFIILLKWPDFCSALIVGRLVPLDVDDTRFPPLRVSCSPGTGAGASSPRHETHRNVANSRSFRSAKGLRRHTSSVLYAPSALSAMALSYESPTVPVDGSIPYSITPVAYTMPVHCVPWSLLNRCRFNSD